MENEQGNKDREREWRERVFASESQHWYHPNGMGCHQILKVKKRKGDPDEYRPATIADARKMGLVPSVTNLIGKFSNKAGIEIWKRGLLLKQFTNEKIAYDLLKALDDNDEEGVEKIFKKVADGAEAEASKAAEIGTLSHYALETGITLIASGETLDFTERWIVDVCYPHPEGSRIAECVMGVIRHMYLNLIIFNGVKILQEKSFAFNIILPDGTEFGLGGKIDLIIEYSPGNFADGLYPVGPPSLIPFRDKLIKRAEAGLPSRLLIDFKTRGPNRLKSGLVQFPGYSSDITQLAGYSEAAKFAGGFKPDAACNVLISSDSMTGDEALEIQFRVYDEKDIARGVDSLRSYASLWAAEERLTQDDPYIPCIPQ